MEKLDFKDYPNLTTPLNASNLNKLQTNIENAINSSNNNITTAQEDIDNIETNIDDIEADITNVKTDANNLANRVSTLEIVRGLPDYGDGNIDCNTTTYHLILSQNNTPNNSLYFVITLFFGGKTATANRTQIAIPYNYASNSIKNTVQLRYYFNGAWTTWRLVNS